MISTGTVLNTQNPGPLLGLNLTYFDSIPMLFRCACTLKLKWHWFKVLRLEWEIFLFVCLPFAVLECKCFNTEPYPQHQRTKKIGTQRSCAIRPNLYLIYVEEVSLFGVDLTLVLCPLVPLMDICKASGV